MQVSRQLLENGVDLRIWDFAGAALAVALALRRRRFDTRMRCRAGGLLFVALCAFHSALPLHPDVDASPTHGTRTRPVAPFDARAAVG